MGPQRAAHGGAADDGVRRQWATKTVSAGGRNFTSKRRTARSWSPGIAEIITRSHREAKRRSVADTPDTRKWQADVMSGKPSRTLAKALKLGELVDETGMASLYTSGEHSDKMAEGLIMFPDQRWLRFPVRGTKPADAIMTAVDQAGNRVARYRLNHGIEITVHPDQPLTDELVLALMVSAPWLRSYFRQSKGEGG